MAFSLFDTAAPEGPFSVLTVCTGNVCRSPLAAQLLQKALRGTPSSVGSAGIQALVGEPMTEQNRRIAVDLGVTSAEHHRARQLTPAMLRDADLVLALSREHRRAAVEILPRAARKTFTLREFGRLAAALDLDELTQTSPAAVAEASGPDLAQRMRYAVEAVARIRGTIPPPTALEDDDVIDPFQQSDAVYERSAEQIVPALNATSLFLRGAAIGRR